MERPVVAESKLNTRRVGWWQTFARIDAARAKKKRSVARRLSVYPSMDTMTTKALDAASYHAPRVQKWKRNCHAVVERGIRSQ